MFGFPVSVDFEHVDTTLEAARFGTAAAQIVCSRRGISGSYDYQRLQRFLNCEMAHKHGVYIPSRIKHCLGSAEIVFGLLKPLESFIHTAFTISESKVIITT